MLRAGLDARAAAIVMRTVRNTVNTGRTVVCTIHQPSIDIFEVPISDPCVGQCTVLPVLLWHRDVTLEACSLRVSNLLLSWALRMEITEIDQISSV